MLTRTPDISRLILPVRPRTVQGRDSNLPAKLALADRIAELPGIQVTDDDPVGGSRKVSVLLTQPSSSVRKQREPLHLCRIGSDGMLVFGLSDRDRYRVLSRGWGRLFQNSVMLFLPRNDEELEIAWHILRRAYDALIEPVVQGAPVRPARLAGMPRFSRTNLQ